MVEIHLDPLGGIAGDMFVAAILDFRPDLEEGLRQTLALCPLIHDVEFVLTGSDDGVLTGRRFLVSRPGKEDHVRQHRHDRHSHANHDHVHGGHDDDHGHPEHPHAGHGHIRWSLIRETLVVSRLDPETTRHAIGIFSRLAEAEGKVHGVPPDEVSFHEVGAWDSIADIVAAAWLITRLGATRWTAGPVPLGSGRVATDHGPLPVPAPATARLLEGFATIDDGIGGERVTPTGAAILSYLCRSHLRDERPPHHAPRILKGSGCGFGTKRLAGIRNCLRLLAFSPVEAASIPQDRIAVLECEIDDQSAEDLAQAIETLRAQDGVLDVIQAPVFGKKGRMMTHLRILAEPEALDAVLMTAFDETTTIGIRHALVERSVLPRRTATVDAAGKSLRLKIVARPSGQTAKVEADDLADVAGSGTRNALRHLARTNGDGE